MLPMSSLQSESQHQSRTKYSLTLSLTLIMTPKDCWVKVHRLTGNRICTYITTPNVAMKRDRSQFATMRVKRSKQSWNDLFFEIKHQLLNFFARALRC